MLTNYLKIAFRNLWINRMCSGINLFGLTVGVASCLLILLFVNDERNYDHFLPDAERIYQVNIAGNFGGSEFNTNGSPPPVGRTMADEFPEVETYTRTFKPSDAVVQRKQGDQALHYFTESTILAVDSNFLRVFRFTLLAGDAATCLQEPNSVVVTEQTARKYFGRSTALDQFLYIDDQPVKITGVLRDVPTQSTLQFDFLRPVRDYSVVANFDWSWVWLNVNTYVRLNEVVARQPGRVQALEAKFPAMVREHAAGAFERIGQPFDKFVQKGGRWDFSLQPFLTVHLNSAGIGTNYKNLGDAKQVKTFAVIALFIIVLACVNFMNLATARSVKRAKEVGVRKVLGSTKNSLIGQFLTESMLYSLLATGAGIGLATLALPLFNQVANKTFAVDALWSADSLGASLLLAALVGLLTGSYPAFYLTAFSPVQTLKNGLQKSAWAHQLIRNGLVVFQFSVSTALLIGTIVVFGQLRFAQTKDLGFDKENVLILPNASRLGQNQEAFRQELLRQPDVLNASLSTSVPLKGGFGDFYVPEQTHTDKQVAKDLLLFSYMTDYELVPTLNIKLVEGRNFSRDFADSASVILNETAVKQIGWEDPIGRTITYPGGNDQKFTVIGVMKNFDMSSVRYTVDPFALFHVSSKTYQASKTNLIIRLRAGRVNQAVAGVRVQWKHFAPDAPFDYAFLDREFAQAYRTEQQTGQVFGGFTALAIFIASLGLFGLAVFTAEQRTKEIGVRKVLGASVASIVALLSKDFLKLVLIAIVIASPIAWYAMNEWLADFAYKIDISWWYFALAGGLAVGIALLTVSFQSVKAALANPVESLRSE